MTQKYVLEVDDTIAYGPLSEQEANEICSFFDSIQDNIQVKVVLESSSELNGKNILTYHDFCGMREMYDQGIVFSDENEDEYELYIELEDTALTDEIYKEQLQEIKDLPEIPSKDEILDLYKDEKISKERAQCLMLLHEKG